MMMMMSCALLDGLVGQCLSWRLNGIQQQELAVGEIAHYRDSYQLHKTRGEQREIGRGDDTFIRGAIIIN